MANYLKQKINKPATGQLRIIGGQWRGRKIEFPIIEGLRPTTDFVRETLFNWLQFDIQGKRCLDLFAGSGVLGFEALSRGAAQVIALEQSAAAIAAIKNNAAQLKISDLLCYQANTLHWLTQPQHFTNTFDLVFLDPPYHKDLVLPCIGLLKNWPLLAKNATIYLETEAKLGLTLPHHWQISRQKNTDEFNYYLLKLL